MRQLLPFFWNFFIIFIVIIGFIIGSYFFFTKLKTRLYKSFAKDPSLTKKDALIILQIIYSISVIFVFYIVYHFIPSSVIRPYIVFICFATFAGYFFYLYNLYPENLNGESNSHIYKWFFKWLALICGLIALIVFLSFYFSTVFIITLFVFLPIIFYVGYKINNFTIYTDFLTKVFFYLLGGAAVLGSIIIIIVMYVKPGQVNYKKFENKHPAFFKPYLSYSHIWSYTDSSAKKMLNKCINTFSKLQKFNTNDKLWYKYSTAVFFHTSFGKGCNRSANKLNYNFDRIWYKVYKSKSKSYKSIYLIKSKYGHYLTKKIKKSNK